MRIISGNSNQPLVEALCRHLGLPVTPVIFTYFSDHDIHVEIKDDVAGHDIIVIQSLSFPANDHFMELALLLDALKRSYAKKITLILPYFAYARHDRKKEKTQSAIGAKVIADLLSSLWYDQIITFDLHSLQIEGFFNKPVYNISLIPLFYEHINRLSYQNIPVVVVSPDLGGVIRGRSFAAMMEVNLVILNKKRDDDQTKESKIIQIIGDVQNKNCILIDDIVDSANTLCNAAKILKENGANHIVAYSSHGIFSNDALQKIMASPLDWLTVTNTVKQEVKSPKLDVIDISFFLSELIKSYLQKGIITS